jgi:hypothetical protein
MSDRQRKAKKSSTGSKKKTSRSSTSGTSSTRTEKARETFLTKSIAKHNDRYDYSESVFTGRQKPITIKCKVPGHPAFTVKCAETHFRYDGHCPICKDQGLVRKAGAVNKVTLERSLAKTHPHLIDEWIDTTSIDMVSKSSKKRVLWKCLAGLNHPDYPLQVCTRAKKEVCCPECCIIMALETGSLTITHPNIAAEWHPSKNSKKPCEVFRTSDYLAWWICSAGHEKQATVYQRVRKDYCNRCLKKQSSAECAEWLELLRLESIANGHEIYIQHAGNDGEFKIPGTGYRADGYCKETNTIYEYHGSFYHGDPKMFARDWTAVSAKTHRLHLKVYIDTVAREEVIRSLGYNLVVMWGVDFKKTSKADYTVVRETCLVKLRKLLEQVMNNKEALEAERELDQFIDDFSDLTIIDDECETTPRKSICSDIVNFAELGRNWRGHNYVNIVRFVPYIPTDNKDNNNIDELVDELTLDNKKELEDIIIVL